MNPIYTWWFWLLILSFILFAIFFSAFESYAYLTSGEQVDTPYWVWIILVFAFLFSTIALIMYCIAAYNDIKQAKINRACGLTPPEPAEIITCPTDKCTGESQTVAVTPIAPYVVQPVANVCTPAGNKMTIAIDNAVSALPDGIPNAVPNQAFASGSIYRPQYQ